MCVATDIHHEEVNEHKCYGHRSGYKAALTLVLAVLYVCHCVFLFFFARHGIRSTGKRAKGKVLACDHRV